MRSGYNVVLRAFKGNGYDRFPGEIAGPIWSSADKGYLRSCQQRDRMNQNDPGCDAVVVRWEEVTEDGPLRRRPSIGAVVAMVAAARMVMGGWQDCTRRPFKTPPTHWDFMPATMTTELHSACGDSWPCDTLAAGIDDVDCPDCLAIARRAGVLS